MPLKEKFACGDVLASRTEPTYGMVQPDLLIRERNKAREQFRFNG